MLKLIKYEIFRRKTRLISVLLIMVFLEIAILIGINLGGNWIAMSVICMFVLFIGGMLFPFIDTITNYYSDYKNKHGYMLFLTPNSGYKINGSKMLFALVEMLITFLLIVGAFALIYQAATSLFPDVTKVASDMVIGMKAALNLQDMTIWTLSPLMISSLLQYFANIMLAISAITISKTLLSNRSFNWLFALLFYFALTAILEFALFGALMLFGFAGDMIELIKNSGNVLTNAIRYLSVAGGMYLVWIFVAFFISSNLLNKRTDL